MGKYTKRLIELKDEYKAMLEKSIEEHGIAGRNIYVENVNDSIDYFKEFLTRVDIDAGLKMDALYTMIEFFKIYTQVTLKNMGLLGENNGT